MKEAILEDFPLLEKHIEFRHFQPPQESLFSVLQGIQASFAAETPSPHRVSLIAPFFFLKRDGILTEEFPPDSHFFRGLRIFANNYTFQGVKIKNCKSVLNRVYCHLALLDSKQIDACFFAKKKEGVYTIDLRLIPEKDRLDVNHAEEILNKCLKKWLAIVEDSYKPYENQEDSFEI